MEKEVPTASSILTWGILILLVLLILIKGVFTFFTVGDLGQPDWDYRPVRDVPGESPYAIYEVLPYIFRYSR